MIKNRVVQSAFRSQLAMAAIVGAQSLAETFKPGQARADRPGNGQWKTGVTPVCRQTLRRPDNYR